MDYIIDLYNDPIKETAMEKAPFGKHWDRRVRPRLV